MDNVDKGSVGKDGGLVKKKGCPGFGDRVSASSEHWGVQGRVDYKEGGFASILRKKGKKY